MVKDSEPKVTVCDQDGCIIPATHTLVWTKQQNYCPIHINTVLNVARVMGFPTPSNTVRKMTIEERFVGGE